MPDSRDAQVRRGRSGRLCLPPGGKTRPPVLRDTTHTVSKMPRVNAIAAHWNKPDCRLPHVARKTKPEQFQELQSTAGASSVVTDAGAQCVPGRCAWPALSYSECGGAS